MKNHQCTQEKKEKMAVKLRSFQTKSVFHKIKSFLLKSFFFIHKLFISVKLAVFTLTALSVLIAIGTFVESRYDQETANKLVYHSLWMAIALSLLALNLTMVLIDRWPWKKRHTPFILAHIGILILISGSLVTKYFGLDGSLRFKEGEKSSELSIPYMEIKIYSSYDGENFTLIHEEPVDMFFKKPTEKKPYFISAAGELFVIDRYLPFAIGREVFKPVVKGGVPAIRFHLDGSQASLVEWMRLDVGEDILSKPLGPAVISLTKNKNYRAKQDKELVLFVEGEKIFYSLARGKKNLLNKGDVFPTKWMDFKFRLIEFFPKSQREFVFESRDKPSDITLKAVRVTHQGNSVWIGQNSYVRLFKENRVYAMAYLNRTYNLGFDLELIDFRMTKYQGSERTKSYESEVHFDGQTRVISMNEPLKHKGYTFYQSSFEPSQDEREPVVSILSVNQDPGRALKYFGSILIVAGIALLFYRRKMNSPGA